MVVTCQILKACFILFPSTFISQLFRGWRKLRKGWRVMPSERNISKMSCNMNVSLLSSKLLFWKEGSREGNIEESLRTFKPCSCLHGKGPSHCGRVLLPEAGLHVCDPAECGRLPSPVPSHLNVSVIEGKEWHLLTRNLSHLEIYSSRCSSWIFPFPPALLTLVVKRDQKHLFYNVKIAEIAYHLKQVLNVNP